MTLNEYINSIKHKRIGVIGIGVSNTPLIKKLLESGCDVTACDKRTAQQLGDEFYALSRLGAKFCLGEDYLEKLDFDLIFRTPGLMPFDENLQAAVSRGAELTSEMELFMKLCRFFGVVWCKFVLVVKNKSVVFVLIRKYRAFGIDIILIILMLIKMVRRYVRYHGDIGFADHAVQLERAELENCSIVFSHIVNIT